MPQKRRPYTQEREPRTLSPKEALIRSWIQSNYGVLSRVAKSNNVSVTFVNRIAYNRDAKSQDYIIERVLLNMGCPLIQKIP